MGRRVVVTGLGIISPVGNTVEEFFQNLISGKCGIDVIDEFDVSEHKVKIAGQVKNFEPKDFMDPKTAKRLDRFTHFALAASKMAVEDAGLDIASYGAERVGVIIGSGIGGIRTFETQYTLLTKKGPGKVSPFFVPMMIGDTAPGQVSLELGAKGPNFDVVSACASGANAIGEAFETIRRGDSDICIAGGAEAPITPLTIAGFANMNALSTRNDEPQKASRPFDKERDGFVMAEGAGILIIEELESAIKRGAKIYCELAGYGSAGDAYHQTMPDPDSGGTVRAMTVALEKAGLKPEEVNYINAHGTSTPYNDKFETNAIKKVFGAHAEKLLISSIKSMTGHSLGAAGSIEAVASVMTIIKGIVPPTINYENPDEECNLNYVPNKSVNAEVNVVMSNSLGFGGHNAILIFKKY